MTTTAHGITPSPDAPVRTFFASAGASPSPSNGEREKTAKSLRFRAEREHEWRKLEDLLSRIERRSGRALSDDEIVVLPVLYRSALSSLSVARAISLDASLVAYLESLSIRGYFSVYGPRTTVWARIGKFFRLDWPQAARDLWRETLAAAILTFVGAAIAYALTQQDPGWFYSFVPGGLAEGRVPTASTASLRGTLFHPAGGFLSVFATFLFTHNAQIALFAFALGFASCVPAAILLLYNGMTLGAFFAVFRSHGLGLEFGGWTLIHGSTELFAIVLSGAAGFRVGWTLAFPGTRSRVEAVSAAGRQAAIILTGTIVMLGIAGLLEGIARQVVTDTATRYGVAVGVFAMWVVYLYLPRRSLDHDRR